MRKISWIAMLFLLLLTAASAVYAVGVRGQVVDEDGTPKDLVKVDFGTDEESEPIATAWTDDYGNFGANVPAGDYKVTVSDGEDDGDSSSIDVKVDPSGKMSPSTLEVDW